MVIEELYFTTVNIVKLIQCLTISLYQLVVKIIKLLTLDNIFCKIIAAALQIAYSC